MSVNVMFKRLVNVGLIIWIAAGVSPVSARDWAENWSTPLLDPLLARPPQLESDKILPGDTEPYRCNANNQADLTLLTLSDVVDFALCHNPQVQSSLAAVKVQTALVGESRAAYLPTINAGISRLHQKSEYPESRFSVNTERTNDSKYVTLTWRLMDFGARNANRRSAYALLEAALASQDAVLQKTMASVIGYYFDAQTAKASRDAKEKNAALAMQTLQTTQKREAQGIGPKSDTLQAKTALAKAELDMSRSAGAYEKSLAVLVVAMGLPAQSAEAQNLMLAHDYADAENTVRQDLATWLTLARDQHPSLLAARAQLKSVKEKLTVVRSEGLPTLDFTNSLYINGRPNQGLTATQTQESVIGLTMNFPLFEGFGRTYKVRGAEAQIELKEAELRDTQNQLLSEVVKAHADANAALRNIDGSKHLIEAAQDAMDNVRRKYDRGLVDILEMLSVQMALADAMQERVRTLSEWRSARLRLLAAAGAVGLNEVRGKN
jgi:outer membrane protein